MTAEQRYLLALLRAFLHNTAAPAPPEGLDGEALHRLSVSHGVAGICGMALTLSSADVAAEAFRRSVEGQLARSDEMERIWRGASAAMGRVGVPHLLVKGPVIQGYYSIPALRSMGDVDFVVEPAARADALTALRAAGFTCRRAACDCDYARRGTVRLELHTAVAESYRWNGVDCGAFFTPYFAGARPFGGSDALVWDEVRCFLFTVAHLAHHLTSTGAGVRMVLDVAAMLHAGGLTRHWNQVEEGLVQLGLSTAAAGIFALCRDWLDVAVPDGAGDYPPALEDYVLAGGVFGFDGPAADPRLRAGGSGAFIALRSLFPPREYLYNFLPAAQGHPALLPAAWCAFFYDKAWRRRRRSAALVHSLMTERPAARRQRELLLALGLNRPVEVLGEGENKNE